jgi:hypothetical protein
LQPSATLILKKGEVYDFRNLTMKSKSQVVVEGAVEQGDTRVRIQTGFFADNGTYVGPAKPSSATAANIRFYVNGLDVDAKFNSAVLISPNSVVAANIEAYNGTLTLSNASTATGAFYGKQVVIGNTVILRLNAASQLTQPFFVPQTAAASSAEVSAKEEETAGKGDIPDTYVLVGAYPNPFNPSTQIRYGLPQMSHVSLTVFNMLGQEVARLVDEVQSEGYHVVRWDGRAGNGATATSGVYFYRIQAEGFVETKKMVLLK